MTGIICIYKEKEITSFGVVNRVRGILGEKKAGHTGTLDPMATGVLPIMLGGATKFLNFLPESDKAYRASFLLGKTTDTLDITGKVLSEKEVNVTPKEVENALSEFRGAIMQTPPMFSAKSIDGVRLYDLARQGKEVEREACEVEIKKLELVSFNENEYIIDVLCSKGTYIRSLIDDIGKKLGCGAVMTALERTGASGFGLEDCVTLDALQKMRDSGGDLEGIIKNVESLYSDYESVRVTPAQSNRFKNGGALDIKRIKKPPKENERVKVYSFDGEFLGLGINKDEELKALRLLIRK